MRRILGAIAVAGAVRRSGAGGEAIAQERAQRGRADAFSDPRAEEDGLDGRRSVRHLRQGRSCSAA